MSPRNYCTFTLTLGLAVGPERQTLPYLRVVAQSRLELSLSAPRHTHNDTDSADGDERLIGDRAPG
jgi:hypothetical protein